MTLATGTRFGPYEIADQIGKGGMGEVYRATDTKLGREVAIKILPSALANDTDRLARFEREAKLLATLNHSHIASVFSLDEHEGTLYLAMELVEGETLEEKLKTGPLPVEDALRLGLQIAQALEAAHAKGVIHRDLKPANVMITPDGVVKVLDFGLAKVFSNDPDQASPEHSPALSLAMTQAGLILGTAGYMSPEQASGQPTDQRGDIWAFGVVLYEMLTGLPLFGGESVPHILADVLKTEPDWSRLPKNLHPRLKLMLERCLTKRPRDRYHSIADARVDIQYALTHPDVAGSEAVTRQPAGLRWLPYVASLALAAIVAGLLLWPDPLPDVVRFEIVPGPGEKLPPGVPAVSPDGRMLAYVVQGQIGRRLHVRNLDSVESRALPGTEGVVYAFWSPDGRSLGFASVSSRSGGITLKRIDIAAGSPRDVAENVRGPWHGAWGPGGDILHLGNAGLSRISAGGNVATPAERIEGQLAFPYFLPDGERFLTYNYADRSIELARLDDPTRSIVLENVASAPILAPTPGGTTYLLYLRGPDLMAQEFDESSGSLRGDAVVLISGIGQVASPPVRPTVGVSPAGVLAYQTGIAVEGSQWQWVDRTGAQLEVLPEAVAIITPQLSADESTLAGVRTDNMTESVWTIDLARAALTRRTFSDGRHLFPVWSPDGARLAFVKIARTENEGLYVLDLATGSERRLSEYPMRPTSWSPDGRYLLAQSDSDIWLVSVDGDEDPVAIGSRNGRAFLASFSPAGDYIAFSSDESGRSEVYVVPMPPATGPQVPVSINGGTDARWRADGRELFFIGSGTSVMAVDVDTDAGFSAGIPESLFFSGSILTNTGFAVARDGERFLIPASAALADLGSAITVVLNWWVELESLP